MPTPRTMMASSESVLGRDEAVRPNSMGSFWRGIKGRGVLTIFALFRQRRAPRPRRKAGNGGWQDIGLTNLGGPMPAARTKKAAANRPKTRREAVRQDP